MGRVCPHPLLELVFWYEKCKFKQKLSLPKTHFLTVNFGIKFVLLHIVVNLLPSSWNTVWKLSCHSLWYYMLLFRLKEVKKKEEVRKQEIKKGKMGAGGLVSA